MPSVLENICVAVTSGECLVGFCVNGFIGLVNCIECVKTRRMTSIDFILTGLAISRIGILLALILMNFFDFFYFKTNVISNWKTSGIIWNFSNHSGAWFGSCLSIFYFLKIATFSHPAFLWLKWRVNKVVLRMLLGCWLTSSFIILPTTERITKIQVVPIDQENKTTITHINQGSEILKCSIPILFSTGGLVPCALSVISCFLLVLSLWKHTQQMHLKVTGYRDPGTKAHVRAMKTIISFLFLFVLYHSGLIMGNLNMSVFRSKLVAMFSLTVMSVYPMTHSIILILGHSKLRHASLGVLGKLKDHLKVPGKV
ncbi:taste receptor type 2 member 7-like [Phascolarctos cinereus]|uniref:Taste receptor type 2 n=1 Tax=Phascolarctos cinereus TaxID=38626 RepID=A0A6P5J9I2_PHACI|nr:taste receptor type 2 member 7-like [Phascolarctos cinereus]